MPNGLHDMFLDQIGAQLPQRPAAIRQPDDRGRLISQPNQFRHLCRRDPHGDTPGSQLVNGRQAYLLERMQVCIDGVRMYPLRVGNLHRAQSHPVQNQGFGAPLLMQVGQSSHALTQLPNFAGRGTANFHWTSHGNASLSERCHSNNDLWTDSHNN